MTRTCAALVALVVLLTACGGQSGASNPSSGKTVVKFVTSDDPTKFAALYGIEKGKVTSNSVEIKVDHLATAAASAAVNTKAYNVVEANFLNVAQLAEGGLKTKILSGGLENRGATLLFTGKNSAITNASQLKGKKIAVPTFGTIYTLESRYVLNKKYGLNTDLQKGDLQWAETGGFDTTLAAVRTGAADAGVVTQLSAWQAIINDPSGDFRILDNLSQSWVAAGNGYVANTLWLIYADPQSVSDKDAKEVLRMLDDAHTYLRANLDQVIKDVSADRKAPPEYLYYFFTVCCDYISGPISERQKTALLAGMKAAKDIGVIKSVPDWKDISLP